MFDTLGEIYPDSKKNITEALRDEIKGFTETFGQLDFGEQPENVPSTNNTFII